MDTSRWRPLALTAKAALAALLALAVAFPEWDRFADKAMGVRVAAYPAAVMLVTLVWALRSGRDRSRPFPWDVDLLVTLPFLVDVAGNAADLYDTVTWFDDACHFGNWALLSGAAGVALRRWAGLRPWTLALTCAGAGAIAAILWEFFEYGVFILDTPETVTIYRDTIGDLMLGLAGSTVAGLLVAALARRGTGSMGTGSVDERLRLVPERLLHEDLRAGDPYALEDVLLRDLPAGRALGAQGDASGGQNDGEQVVEGSGVR
jgi:hypothetical protein